MRRKNFLKYIMCVFCVGYMFSCTSAPLFKSKDDCISYIKSQHQRTNGCPGMSDQPNDYKWLRWISEQNGEMLNGTVSITFVNYTNDEVDYMINYNYSLYDRWIGFGEIPYNTEHKYEVSRLWHISKGNKNRPVLEFVSGRVHEYREESGPYNRIDITYDE